MVKVAGKELAKGISALGRAKTYKRRGLWAIKKKNGGKFPVHAKKEKTTAVTGRPSRFYPADDITKPLSKTVIRKPTKLRTSITPGTVLILLSGRFKGKRVVFLKQLPSGILLVTGPFKLNGVPARRVNQAYVIATSTKVELPELNLDSFTDATFKAVEAKKKKKGADEFFESDKQTKEPLPAEVIESQKKLDAAILGVLSEDLKGYLAHRFGLKDGDRPHLMKF